MSYWLPDTIQTCIRKRYANRFVYLASILIFLLFFILCLSDPNMRVWGWLLLIWPILHTTYLLYLEYSERAIERAMHTLRDDHHLRLADDGEIADVTFQELPKRKHTSQD
ncbi:MAG: hypothetical protein KF716_27280 [Anaerolineae bacterium]|nr:hypothetical protein [Anaerolineae bacterium]